MISKMKPISLAEVKEIVKDVDEKKNLDDYLKKFCKVDKTKVDDFSREIEKLDNLKIKDEHVIKMIDFLPSDAEDVNKIFNDVSLNEGEINALLEIIKKY